MEMSLLQRNHGFSMKVDIHDVYYGNIEIEHNNLAMQLFHYIL